MLTNTDISELIAFRRQLHRLPELSQQEYHTAKTITAALKTYNPDRLLTKVGGCGVAAIFDSGKPGPSVLFRAELDALPIEEKSGVAWASEEPGKAHLCGHDGHMTIVVALGRLISRQRIQKGRCILMFQPAEEDGSGARAVIADPQFQQIAPDWAFAIHNEPGLPFGYVGIKDGLINCASRGVKIILNGRTSHAAEPELAHSPITLLPHLIQMIDGLGTGGELDNHFTLTTITHVNVGTPTFGITPGHAVIFVTLRASLDSALDTLYQKTVAEVTKAASAHQIQAEFEIHDDFAVSLNDKEAVEIACKAMDELDIRYGGNGVPMRASEDFGAFGWNAKAAMLCLGPGRDHAALHQPEYDFADDLIPIGAHIFERIARNLLG